MAIPDYPYGDHRAHYISRKLDTWTANLKSSPLCRLRANMEEPVGIGSVSFGTSVATSVHQCVESATAWGSPLFAFFFVVVLACYDIAEGGHGGV
jgi:hypothetical protein